ncbi:spermidine synthase [Gilvimarinus xylanilyticus]|uniref:Spermidine synthase n=1 Tax=Gilvimarinus xylanilyticus TaxID=2944139 RepID=A0A9X2KTS6_9GAMM|nr:spermidine synthase [Gilvimarinus xylanilyticus]MCP8899502.1 spermidine synthase [Gilvimarinus xylanilyticus]
MPLFEELDTQDSPIGEISLRRRRIPILGDRDIYEVKLGDEFLMSSMFVAAEEALSSMGLAAVEGDKLDVVVGGLGLGYTAVEALKDKRVNELLVVDFLETVIGWHKDELVPLGKTLNADPRNRYIHGSFFDLAVDPATGFDPDQKARRFDAILLDIDHSPTEFLHEGNAGFYTTENLTLMAQQLKPKGVFAMWSQNPPEPAFEKLLASAFSTVDSHLVEFYNPFQNNQATNTVYVCQ